jgi:hypothetical protein
MNRPVIKLGFLAAIVLVTAAADQQDPYSFVRNRIRNATVEMSLEGLPLTHEVTFDALYDGDSSITTATLQANRTYYILGECDYDCHDLDLILYNERGVFIKQDMLPNDSPWLRVTPTRTRTFQIETVMARCDDEPCIYGLAIYAR